MSKKGLIGLGIGAAIVVGGISALFLFGPASDYSRAAGELDAALTDAQQFGVPMEVSDTTLTTAVPTELNAGPVLTNMSTKYTASKVDSGAISGGMEDDPEKIAAARAELAKMQPIFDLAERAAELPHCQFERDWSNALTVDFPEYSSIKGTVRALGVRAVLSARDGDAKSALRDLRTAEALAQHSRSEPVLIAMLVGIANQALTNHAAIGVAEHLESESDLLALKAVLEERQQPIYLADYLEVETLFGAQAISRIEQYGGSEQMMMGFSTEQSVSSATRLAHLTSSEGTRKRAYMARHLQFWNHVYSLGDDLRDNQKVSERLAEASAQLYGEPGVSYEMQQILMPVFASSGDSITQRDASRMATLAMLDVLLHRARTGSLPATLEEAGVTSLDPFSDKPFRYEKIEGGFRIWSVGSDRDDDNGRKGTNDGDIVFTFPGSLEEKP